MARSVRRPLNPLRVRFQNNYSFKPMHHGSEPRTVHDEASQVHFRDAGWKGNEGSDDWQQPAGKDYQLAPPRKPSVSQVGDRVAKLEHSGHIFR